MNFKIHIPWWDCSFIQEASTRLFIVIHITLQFPYSVSLLIKFLLAKSIYFNILHDQHFVIKQILLSLLQFYINMLDIHLQSLIPSTIILHVFFLSIRVIWYLHTCVIDCKTWMYTCIYIPFIIRKLQTKFSNFILIYYFYAYIRTYINGCIFFTLYVISKCWKKVNIFWHTYHLITTEPISTSTGKCNIYTKKTCQNGIFREKAGLHCLWYHAL